MNFFAVTNELDQERHRQTLRKEHFVPLLEETRSAVDKARKLQRLVFEVKLAVEDCEMVQKGDIRKILNPPACKFKLPWRSWGEIEAFATMDEGIAERYSELLQVLFALNMACEDYQSFADKAIRAIFSPAVTTQMNLYRGG